MSAKQLRGFMFDPAHTDEQLLIKNVFSTWQANNAIAVINENQPKNLIEDTIIKYDLSDIVYADQSTKERSLAIIENPDLGLVCATSGTTGDPKAAELSFSAMESSVNSLYRLLNLRENTPWLCCLAPYYVAGISIFARCFIKHSELIFHNSFDPQRINEEINNGFDGAISLVVPQLLKLLENDVDLSPLAAVLIGGSHIPEELVQHCSDKNINIHTTYGMTETLGGICHDGKVFDNTKVRIVDDEIQLQSGSLFSGYRHDHIATSEKFTADGWFKTNDRGSYDDKVLQVWGRNDDVINSGGIKIDPVTIEKLLTSQYRDIELVIGATPHPKLGQACTLFTTSTNLSLEDVREFLSQKLPRTHLPIRVAKVKSFQFTNTGKIKRNFDDYDIIEDHAV